MIDDRRVVVIGSGLSGSIAALALLQQGIPVTMLESGESFPGGLLIRMMGRNVYRRRPLLEVEKGQISSDNPDAVSYRAMVPGGLSNYWTGAVPRFAPEDFYEGERLHERFRWPVSYADLVPYYARVERLMGVSGSPQDVLNLPACNVGQPRRLPKQWQHVAVHAASYGHGLAPLPMADLKSWLLTQSGAAFNSFTQLVPVLRRFTNFELRLGAHALRLEWCGKKKKVESLVFFDRSSCSEQQINCAAVVLAGGPLGSTKLLLDSACTDFPNGLGDTEGILGRYLHDHPKDWWVIELDRPLPRLGHAAYLTRAPYDQSPPLMGVQSVIGNSGGSVWAKACTFTPYPSTTFGVATFATMIPTRDNFVGQHTYLKDAFGLPALDLHIRYGDEVPKALATAQDRLLTILELAGYRGTVRTAPTVLKPGASVHYAGSIRAHDSPRYGMVNKWNQLHAINNVVVADASCFTTAVEKNPVLTSMALGMRAAEHLADDLKTSTRRPQTYFVDSLSRTG